MLNFCFPTLFDVYFSALVYLTVLPDITVMVDWVLKTSFYSLSDGRRNTLIWVWVFFCYCCCLYWTKEVWGAPEQKCPSV